MLILKDIHKTYKSKKGSDCAALKGININFPDKGMVFILGKSGSGKSTLLNVIGGLDAPDSGEIIIKGKSSKDFTPSDYDSYRNTYLGFIFQEYNVMDDFAVYDNVALALRLQGKKAEKESVKKILEQVGLEGYENRKPNELSGGQKQRVAIARALVKEPEIIFGDEPTGNLDTATSAQIFNLLQELAKEKLVVIVSHDRDSAERYADRIIELSDGFVITDESRDSEAKKDFEITQKEITIPKNRALTNNEIHDLNLAIVASKGKAKIKQTSISKFKKTDKVINTKNVGFKLIKSKFPNRFATKIGASNFKTKKFRLIITIFLTIISLSLFGLSQIFSSYDLPYASANSFVKNDVGEVIIKKGQYDENFGTFLRTVEDEIADEDIDKILETFPDLDITKYYDISFTFGSSSSSMMDIFMSMLGKNLLSPYITKTYGTLVLSEQDLAKYYLQEGQTDIIYFMGGYPTNNDEVLITDYLAHSLILSGKANNINVLDVTNYNYLLSHGFEDQYGFKVNISGIINTGYAAKYYEIISLGSDNEAFTNHEDYDNYAFTATNFYGVLIAKDEAYIDHVIQNSILATISSYKLRVVDGEYQKRNMASTKMIFKTEKLFDFGYSLQELYNEHILTDGSYADLMSAEASDNAIILPASVYDALFNTQTSIDVNDFVPKQIVMGTFGLISFVGSAKQEEVFNVVGVVDIESLATKIANDHPEFASIKNYIFGFGTDELVQQLNANEYTIKGLYITLPDGERNVEQLLRLLDNNLMYHESELSDTIYMVAQIFDIFAIIFQWVALILGIFSVILLFNFISMSVINKQKEIGILRAIGAKGTDVSKIFLIEAFIVAAITVVFSWALIFLGVWGINSLLVTNFKSFLQSAAIEKISLLAAGIVPLGAVLLACVVITLIATIIPTIKISKMKPVDAIKKAN